MIRQLVSSHQVANYASNPRTKLGKKDSSNQRGSKKPSDIPGRSFANKPNIDPSHKSLKEESHQVNFDVSKPTVDVWGLYQISTQDVYLPDSKDQDK